MDASRYFTAMHNAMSAQHPRAQLLLTVKLQDTCGNDACLAVSYTHLTLPTILRV